MDQKAPWPVCTLARTALNNWVLLLQSVSRPNTRKHCKLPLPSQHTNRCPARTSCRAPGAAQCRPAPESPTNTAACPETWALDVVTRFLGRSRCLDSFVTKRTRRPEKLSDPTFMTQASTDLASQVKSSPRWRMRQWSLQKVSDELLRLPTIVGFGHNQPFGHFERDPKALLYAYRMHTLRNKHGH